MMLISRVLGGLVLSAAVALRFNRVREVVYRYAPNARQLLDRYYPVGRKTLGFRDFPRSVETAPPPTPPAGRHFESTYGEA